MKFSIAAGIIREKIWKKIQTEFLLTLRATIAPFIYDKFLLETAFHYLNYAREWNRVEKRLIERNLSGMEARRSISEWPFTKDLSMAN